MPETTAPQAPYSPTGWVAVLTDGRRINVQTWHHANGAALLVDAEGARLVQAVTVPGFLRLARVSPTHMSL